MNITIEQIEQDIENGKSTHIYTSANSCWWTHLESDVIQSTEVGRKHAKEKHKTIMERRDIPKEDLERMDAMFKSGIKDTNIPMDPTGSVLYYMDNPKKWMKSALSKPEHYGKHKFDALLLSHHQNCNNQCLNGWDDYNKVLDLKSDRK